MNQCICINDLNPGSQDKIALFTISEIYDYEYMTEGIYKGGHKLNIFFPPELFKHYMMDLREFRELQLRKVCEEIA